MASQWHLKSPSNGHRAPATPSADDIWVDPWERHARMERQDTLGLSDAQTFSVVRVMTLWISGMTDTQYDCTENIRMEK